MSSAPSAPDESALEWSRVLARYATPDPLRSFGQLLLNVSLYAGLWTLMLASYERAYPITLLLAVPCAGLVLRIFSIQHDCGHGAFFRSRRANDLVGRLLSPVSLVPYGYWRSAHASHHATVGKLDGRGPGHIRLHTVREYRALPTRRRFAYRVYRHPLVLFGLAPAVQFYLRFRVPLGLPEPRRAARASILSMNGALFAIGVCIHFTLGFERFFWIYLPMMTLAVTAGVWLFYVHHEFESTYWQSSPAWEARRAALHGASYYALPPLLRWLTGNTGIHHVHHLCPRVPNYRLPECLRDHPRLAAVSRIGLRESLACGWLALWDEERARLVPFPAARSRRTRPRRHHGYGAGTRSA